jgi:uncharacterized protein
MHSGIGYFVVNVPDAARAKRFYREVLGWQTGAGNDPEGYHHIEGSAPAGGIDAGAAVGRVRELGGAAPDPARSDSGLSVQCTDDQGGRFGLWQPERSYAPDGPPKTGDGDLLYFLLPAADDERAKRFYGGLLGWEFTPGTHPRGWNIANVTPPGGLFGAGAAGPISVYFLVTDIQAALDRVSAAGGTAGAVETNRAGWHARCRDDQGLEFYLSALRDH